MTKLLNRYEGRLVSQIKSVKMAGDSEDLIIEGYANTVTKDRAGDVIPKDTWNKAGALNNFAKNPIILAYHDHSKPIGKATDYFVDDMGLNIKAQISKGAGDVYHLIKDGVLSTFSVGFYIKDAEYLSKTDTYMITELE
jgi:HK97 family phage prohead protease